jgi:hypothetical protein
MRSHLTKPHSNITQTTKEIHLELGKALEKEKKWDIAIASSHRAIEPIFFCLTSLYFLHTISKKAPTLDFELCRHSLVIFLGATLPIPPMSPVSTKRHDECRRDKTILDARFEIWVTGS